MFVAGTLSNLRASCQTSSMWSSIMSTRSQSRIGPVHLFPGALVTFLYPAYPWPAQFDLGELLQSGTAVSLPAVGYQNAYCLVHGATANLCTDCGRHPNRYRDYITDATGADPHSMRLFVANPIPADVALARSVVRNYPCCLPPS